MLERSEGAGVLGLFRDVLDLAEGEPATNGAAQARVSVWTTHSLALPILLQYVCTCWSGPVSWEGSKHPEDEKICTDTGKI